MRAVDLLRCVRDGAEVSGADLRAFVQGISSGSIPDYQASAFLMAVYQRGLSPDSITALTLAMRDSGQVIDLRHVPGIKVDKHSTGGVGDKISLPLAPLVAACGVPVPMVSGRGLGHTGGTLDKLQSIPGFRIDFGIERFRDTVRRVGVCLMGQTGDLAPADKKLYALRDVTATVESIPLITASILAKKLAEGIDALVLDVKVGRGAFMKDLASARQLAESLVRVGQGAGLRMRALLTRMEEPLGSTIGNALEVRESIAILRGHGPADTTDLTLALAAEMLHLGGVAPSVAAARAQAEAALRDGRALAKFAEVIEAHEGNPRVIDDPSLLPQAPQRSEICAARSGRVQSMDSFALGMVAMRLGAGRERAEDTVDPAVGIELLCAVGDSVQAGQAMARVHHRGDASAAVQQVEQAMVLGDAPVARSPAVLLEMG